MSTWTTPVDRATLYVVTHDNWNDMVGAGGNIDWLHDFQGAKVTKTTQSVASGSFVKVAFDTETADPNGWFDNATNFRFTPLHAGKYLVIANVRIVAPTAGVCFLGPYKNGTATNVFDRFTADSTDVHMNVSDVIVCNGTTDYIEIFVQHNHGSNRDVDGYMSVYFVGA